MANNLTEYGHTFQIKSIVCLMTKPNFIEQVIDILDENLYDNMNLDHLVYSLQLYISNSM